MKDTKWKEIMVVLGSWFAVNMAKQKRTKNKEQATKNQEQVSDDNS